MNRKVICLKHPHYDPNQAPDLSCKICCRAYVNNILERQAALRNQSFDTSKWLEEKTKRGQREDVVLPQVPQI